MKETKWVLLLMLFVCQLIQGQERINKEPLIELLTKIEAQHEVKFSYAVSDVRDLFIKSPDKVLSLSEYITYLNQNTLLNFEILDERYIAVTPLNKEISICGFVKENNYAPLLGANIIVSGTSKGAITSFDGKFELNNIPVNAKIVISFIGFKSESFPASDFFTVTNDCKTIYLLEEAQALNQVVITKFLTTGLQKLKDGSTLLNTEKFGILPGLTEPDILQSIQALPGIESTNESIANINVRGGTNDQNLMLWDDIKMYHSGHFFGLISAYNPNLTNKVIVTKNGTSSEYSDGVSSTINMSTKDKIGTSFTGGVGFNLISADAFLEIPLSHNLGLHISGRRSFTDAFTSPTYDKYFERSFQDSDIETNPNLSDGMTNSEFLFYDYTAKLLYDINSDHKIRANVISISNNLDYSEAYKTNEGDSISKSSNLSQENLGAGGSWTAQWSKKFRTKVSGFYSKYNVDASDERVQTNQILAQANEVLETGAKLNTYYDISKHLTLLNGYEFSEIGILNETTVSAPSYERTKKDVLRNHAVYTEMEFAKHFTFVRLGARLNYFQKFDKLLIEPRVSIRQKIVNALALELAGEFKNQSATQIVDFEDDFLGVENRRWILANEENIPISTSQQLSFGAEFSQNDLSINLTAFYKDVDGITVSNQGFYNNFQYLNASGSYTVKGIEFLANKTTDTYSAWISYTNSSNDYEFKTLTPSIFPNNVDIEHSVSMALSLNILEQLKVSLGGMWRTGQPYTKPVEGNETIQNGSTTVVNYDTPNRERLDEFMRLDASLHYTFKFSNSVNASFRAGVINLTNQRNSINRYFEVDPNNSDNAIQIDNKSLGLTPNLSFRVHF
ncbi:MAG: TonB-dependent receptor plug domain-containing protein [Flavobacteriaceae bacterium]|nr:TonB-dependent receptor plug domain-containing protein [Flavobacteriaceae bacterium]